MRICRLPSTSVLATKTQLHGVMGGACDGSAAVGPTDLLAADQELICLKIE